MTMQPSRILATAVLGLVVLAGCGTSPYVPEKKFTAASEKRLVRLAGSRIYQMVDLRDSSPATKSPVTVITRDQIDSQGANSITDLLGFFSYDYSGAPPGN